MSGCGLAPGVVSSLLETHSAGNMGSKKQELHQPSSQTNQFIYPTSTTAPSSPLTGPSSLKKAFRLEGITNIVSVRARKESDGVGPKATVVKRRSRGFRGTEGV